MIESVLKWAESRIGQIWTDADQLRLVIHLRKIDDTVQAIHKSQQDRAEARKVTA